ncbi:MAG: CRTAC1 family protein [Candidatus Dormibacteria bacterium]
MRRAAPWGALLLAVAAVVAGRMYFSTHSSATIDAPPDDSQSRQAAALLASAQVASAPPPAQSGGATASSLAPMIQPLPPQQRVVTQPGLELWGAPYPASAAAKNTFTRIDGPNAGLGQPPLPEWYQAMQPGANQFAPLAAGDVNGDGWPDLAVGTPYGIQLYLNLGGHFAQETIDFPAMATWQITAVALEDLDGDGAPDLVFCAWMHGCHVLWNRGGEFSSAAHTELPRSREIAVQALAFADVDHNGRVDVLTGASTYLEWNFSPANDINRVWHNRGDRQFSPDPLPGPAGETISLLFASLTGGPGPDLYVGNDFDEPDLLFANRDNRLAKLGAGHSPFPYTTTTSMSADTGDITNSGRPAVYLAQIAQKGANPDIPSEQPMAPGTACGAFTDAIDLSNCLALAQFQTGAVRARDLQDVGQCERLPDPAQRRDCVAIGYYWNEAFVNLPNLHADKNAVIGECARVPDALVEFKDVCRAASLDSLDYGQAFKQFPNEMRQVADTNLLLLPGATGYRDATADWGAGFGGWTWNARFADLNNDTWQDLFLTQGSRLRYTSVSNILYENLQGKKFSDNTRASGLEDHVPTGASVFLDYNMDGRLDLVTYPFQLTPVVWRNDLAASPGLQVSLDDRRSANRAGIGARVEIRSADGRMQMRDIKASGGYQSFDEPVAHFGLGDWGSVDVLSVVWPDGQRQEVDGLGLGPGRYRVVRTAG